MYSSKTVSGGMIYSYICFMIIRWSMPSHVMGWLVPYCPSNHKRRTKSRNAEKLFFVSLVIKEFKHTQRFMLYGSTSHAAQLSPKLYMVISVPSDFTQIPTNAHVQELTALVQAHAMIFFGCSWRMTSLQIDHNSILQTKWGGGGRELCSPFN
jgi:hypothetical protein